MAQCGLPLFFLAAVIWGIWRAVGKTDPTRAAAWLLNQGRYFQALEEFGRRRVAAASTSATVRPMAARGA